MRFLKTPYTNRAGRKAAPERIQKANTKELNEIYNELANNRFINYEINLNDYIESFKSFSELDEIDKKTILTAILDLNHLYINFSEIEVVVTSS